MNKITVRGEALDKNIIIKENTVIYYENSYGNINFNIENESNLFIYLEKSNLKINFNINKDLVLNIFSLDSSLDIDLNLNKENISVYYAYSTINIESNDYKININHNKKNQTSNITNHGININNNKLSFIINAIIPRESINISTSQDSKIVITLEKGASIEPNLIIDNDKIEANHSAFIGDFKKEELFYLETRGLSNVEAKKLLAKSFLLGNMKDITFKEIDLIKEKLNMYWR